MCYNFIIVLWMSCVKKRRDRWYSRLGLSALSTILRHVTHVENNIAFMWLYLICVYYLLTNIRVFFNKYSWTDAVFKLIIAIASGFAWWFFRITKVCWCHSYISPLESNVTQNYASYYYIDTFTQLNVRLEYARLYLMKIQPVVFVINKHFFPILFNKCVSFVFR